MTAEEETKWKFWMKHKVHVFNTVILVLVLAAAAAAQSTKIEQLRLDAEQRDACAQNSLGFIYADGKGVPRCFIEANRQASGATREVIHAACCYLHQPAATNAVGDEDREA